MTIEILRSRLTAYLECERKILAGQEYRLGDRMLRRADLSEIRRAISDLQDEIATLTKRGRMKRAVFID
ncbi:MAG: hypothetical protein IKT98_10600 [Selenomonadaceae bacterium]|nr:hypothetical protein [Selenomonadaceae bacterium]